MIWPDEISFDGFTKKINEWYKDKDFELCDPPISAQFALDLIFKTLVDDKKTILISPQCPNQQNKRIASCLI